eukprot:7517734-Pyramimonas_sp.AAC.1
MLQTRAKARPNGCQCWGTKRSRRMIFMMVALVTTALYGPVECISPLTALSQKPTLYTHGLAA